MLTRRPCVVQSFQLNVVWLTCLRSLNKEKCVPNNSDSCSAETSIRSLTSVACFRALGPSPVAPCVAVLNGVQVGADVIQQFNRHGELVAEVARFLGRLRVHLWSNQWSCACRRNAGKCTCSCTCTCIYLTGTYRVRWNVCMNNLHHPMDWYGAAIQVI